MGFVEVVGRRRGRVRNGVCGGSGKEKREGEDIVSALMEPR